MKFFVTFLAFGVVVSVYAQEECTSLVSKIPTCAIECIDTAAASAGCSDPADLACQCENTEKINAQALNCVLSGCGAQQGLEAQSAAAAVCECVASSESSSSLEEEPASTSASASSAAEPSASSSATGSSPPFPTATQAADGQVQAGAASPTASIRLPPSSSSMPFTGAGMREKVPLAGAIACFAAVVAL